MSNLPVKSDEAYMPYQNLEKLGRLHFEYGQRKKDLMADMLATVHQAAVVMGISLDGAKSAVTVNEAMKKILEVYPTAWVEDIKKAVNMASYGQIKLPDQLHTISAHNIFQWYRELRVNHPDKVGEQMRTTYQEVEIPPLDKYRLMARAFNDFITAKNPDPFLRLVYYDRFVKLGYIYVTDERKVELMMAEIVRILDHYPMDIFEDGALRRQANLFKNYFKELPEPKKVNWGQWGDNPILRKARALVKAELVREVVEFVGVEQMMNDFKTQVTNELKITL
jgi:hypothetical protein